MNKRVDKILLDIILSEMNLPTTYGKDSGGNDIATGLIGFTNYNLGQTEKLQIIVTKQSCKPIANNVYYRYVDPNYFQDNTIIMREDLSIDVLSKDTDSLERNWEVLASLRSYYSENEQSKYSFKIFSIPTNFNNVSFVEGSSNLNRFNILISCFVWYTKTKEIDEYYNEFSIRVDNVETIGKTKGLIEFKEPS